MHRAITAVYMYIIIEHLAQFKVALTEALFFAFVKLAKMSTLLAFH